MEPLHVFIISLKKHHKTRTERLVENIKAAKGYESSAIKVIVFPAVEGNTPCEAPVASADWYTPHTHAHMTAGEYGCAASHFTIWRRVNGPTIVFEDDAILQPNFDFAVIRAQLQITSFIYLGRKKMHANEELTIAPNLVQAGFSYWTCAYALDKEAARGLLYNGPLVPVDEYLPFRSGEDTPSADLLRHILPAMPRIPLAAYDPVSVQPAFAANDHSTTFHSNVILHQPSDNRTRLVTVATPVKGRVHDGLVQLQETAAFYGLHLTVLGQDVAWRGGDSNGTGGGHKITLLHAYLQGMTDGDAPIVFCDAFDVIGNNSRMFCPHIPLGSVLFATESSCWPDAELDSRYPSGPGCKNRFLNSGVFAGAVQDMRRVVGEAARRCQNQDDDDQRIFTSLFLEGCHGITLDYEQQLVACLASNPSITVDAVARNGFVSSDANTRPMLVHGNGGHHVKAHLNSLANYCAAGRFGTWHPTYKSQPYPLLTQMTPTKVLLVYDHYMLSRTIMPDTVLLERAQHVMRQITPISSELRVDVQLAVVQHGEIPVMTHPNIIYTASAITDEISRFCAIAAFPGDHTHIFYADGLFGGFVEGGLAELLAARCAVVAPILTQEGHVDSNIWTSVRADRFYARGGDYLDFVKGQRSGILSVPYAWHAFLAERSFFSDEEVFTTKYTAAAGIDITWCTNVRQLHGTNLRVHLGVKGHYAPPFPDLKLFAPGKQRESFIAAYMQPGSPKECGPDIHTGKLFTPQFCEELIAAASAADWTMGQPGTFDPRIKGVENYPTDDVHLAQIGLADMWDFVVQYYVARTVTGLYNYKTKGTHLAFIVRYSMDRQRSLESHHDASVYTVNVALNTSYTGGGCEFERQGLAIHIRAPGDYTLHPGRLTHRHKAIPITSGVRYVLIAFME